MARAYLLCGIWDLPGPGIELISPALAGKFLTSGPPGKPLITFLMSISSNTLKVEGRLSYVLFYAFWILQYGITLPSQRFKL